MNIFKKAIIDIVNWAKRNDYPQDIPSPISYTGSGLKSSGHKIQDVGQLNNGMNFTVFSAIGGKVIQIHSYDPRTDRTNSTLYIVTDQEDLGEELAQIITKESLSR